MKGELLRMARFLGWETITDRPGRLVLRRPLIELHIVFDDDGVAQKAWTNLGTGVIRPPGPSFHRAVEDGEDANLRKLLLILSMPDPDVEAELDRYAAQLRAKEESA